ncbi:GntR family transcriptional regulator [Erwinia psidii]|uniref:GntR family transcriptional regulator n=1 Tax=Erwinia psidii TaxID=69224 RepID=UPI00131592F4|nr:GntR family transcriptional regulator [Erwinia psidii]
MVYLKIYFLLKNSINAGFLINRDSLPSENELARQFDVSRNTLRKALKMLEKDGLLEKRHGSGNFISDNVTAMNDLTGLKGFSEIMANDNKKIKNDILHFEVQTASPIIANALAIHFNEKVWFISRLRWIDDAPVELENTWISVNKFPELTLRHARGSLYHYIENYCHVSISGAYIHYSPLIPSGEIASLLKLKKNNPVIRVQSQSVNTCSIPVIFSENYSNSLDYPVRFFVPRKNIAASSLCI